MNSFVFTLFSFIASLYSGVLGAVEAYAVKHSDVKGDVFRILHNGISDLDCSYKESTIKRVYK